jgi:hypothetical protein
MDITIQTNIDNIWSEDRELQNQAYTYILKATDKPVDWAYEVWDKLVAGLAHKDNHVRAITAQILANLAKSDPEYRIKTTFHSILEVTKDKRFVTARHCMQSIWKIGAAGKKQQKLLVDGLIGRFKECLTEKNCTLIRFDIIQGLRNLYDAIPDETIKKNALALIETEDDLKYRRKYASLWKV